MLVLALNGYQIGLLGSACAFVAFALLVAIVVPRARPDFPSRYLGWFIAAVILFFVGQITAVLLLANYGESEAVAAETTQAPTLPTIPTTTTTASPTTSTETTTTETTTTTQTTTGTTTTGTTTTAPSAGGQGDPAAGRQLFLSQPCGSCHTLKDAGTSGSIGPNLDSLKPPYDKVVTQVTNGGAIMPPFKDKLTPQQIQDIAAYVSSVAGK